MINWQEIKHFKKEEFECKCGCGLNNINSALVLMLNDARERANVPFKINCGCRCQEHNKEVGGVKDSAHLDGFAVDISTPSDSTRFAVVEALLNVGFKRVLLYGSFVHADIDLDKVSPILKIMK